MFILRTAASTENNSILNTQKIMYSREAIPVIINEHNKGGNNFKSNPRAATKCRLEI